jgi:NAD(P)-dependent dehydrogenase (short-subunit alcohol dehydrogenase family)
MTLQNKTAIVTGGGSGIGRACALQLAEAGANVGVSDVNAEGGAETVHLIESAGGQAVFIRCDVTSSAEVKAMVNAAVETFGGLDVAVNNAGVGGTMAALDAQDEATWDTVININLKGVWLCMKYEIPHMLQRGGSIINVASLAGLVGFRLNAVYSASKHGVIGLTKSAALEYARRGIRVNAVCPGFIETPMVADLIEEVPYMREGTVKSSPMRRLGSVEEVATAVLYLAGDGASYINGHALALDGGASAQ